MPAFDGTLSVVVILRNLCPEMIDWLIDLRVIYFDVPILAHIILSSFAVNFIEIGVITCFILLSVCLNNDRIGWMVTVGLQNCQPVLLWGEELYMSIVFSFSFMCVQVIFFFFWIVWSKVAACQSAFIVVEVTRNPNVFIEWLVVLIVVAHSIVTSWCCSRLETGLLTSC